MWKRFAATLRCPLCRGPLEIDSFVETHAELEQKWLRAAETLEVASPDFCVAVEDGQVLCADCHVRYPIIAGLPVMLPYETTRHREFASRWGNRLETTKGTYRFAEMTPAPGENYVRASFSTEWLEYDYDGVIWELNYSDHEVRFRKELGPAIYGSRWFLEVGCGLGLATSVAQAFSGRDCVGMDLSLAVMKATREFSKNPFMHFVQASAFAPPFAVKHFDVVYSRGVLHHTYSTKAAFDSVASLCRPRGTFFLWLYGPGSIKSTPLRIALYALELVFRPIISRAPTSAFSSAFLSTMAVGYVGFNRCRRLFNRDIQPLTFRRAVHAARDRFTPRYAHRHSASEILSWFRSNDFDETTVLDWREMPPADQDDFRRNVGVRAVRAV